MSFFPLAIFHPLLLLLRFAQYRSPDIFGKAVANLLHVAEKKLKDSSPKRDSWMKILKLLADHLCAAPSHS